MGWVIGGSAIAMGVLTVAGLAYVSFRAILLRRRMKDASKRVAPLTAGISAGVTDIEAGVTRAQAGADTLSKEFAELQVSVAELRVIGRHAQVAFAASKGPLGWLAGIRALVKFSRR